MIESGKIFVVIDRTYQLQKLVAAHTDSKTERAVEKIAITVTL
ncbi:zinc-binding dehydrogenase [Tolypothrix tenuis]